MSVDSTTEKQIITGMIISDDYLKGIKPIFSKQLQVPFINTIAGWCMEYYSKYGSSPGHHIKDIYKSYETNLKEEEAYLIEEFLLRLSKKYEERGKFNVDYVLDISEEYFRILKIEECQKRIDLAMAKKQTKKAEQLIQEFNSLSRPKSKAINPFDFDVIKQAFSHNNEQSMFSYPEALGKALGHFEREYLVTIMGVRGTGKTWWLLDMAIQGVLDGFNVVFVSLEMSERQMTKRIHQYLNCLPVSNLTNDDGLIAIPQFIDADTEDEVIETVIKHVTRKQLNSEIASAKIKSLFESAIIRGSFRLLCMDSGQSTMSDLRGELKRIEDELFIPDIIITDYAAKFRPEIKYEKRHQLADIWRSHKALAQERKCLVISASQSNTARTGADIGVGSASESMAAEEESDIILAINQDDEDQKRGLLRMNITKHRHEEYSSKRNIYVTYNFQIGRPHLDSRFQI